MSNTTTTSPEFKNDLRDVIVKGLRESTQAFWAKEVSNDDLLATHQALWNTARDHGVTDAVQEALGIANAEEQAYLEFTRSEEERFCS